MASAKMAASAKAGTAPRTPIRASNGLKATLPLQKSGYANSDSGE